MFLTSNRLKERRKGLKTLNEIMDNKGKSIVIHYSCESFVTSNGNTPRITSICLRHLDNAQTKSFSIHLQAQFNQKDFNNLTLQGYDELEKEMLKKFYEYIEKHKKYKYIHWNMRDSNYGFEAIANRYRILGGKAFNIDEDRRYDLPRILSEIYTYNYEVHKPNGKLLNLASRNGITINDALKGKEEAKAFDDKKYLELHKSTLRKVDIIDSIIDTAGKKELKVNSNRIDIYGCTIPGIIEIVRSNWLLLFFWSVFTYILGVITTILIQKYFK